MTNSGKIKIDDLHASLQDSFVNDRLTNSGGGSGFVGYGFNPVGVVKRIDDSDPAIQYSVGDWTKATYGAGSAMEGINNNQTFTQSIVGAWAKVSFTGTGLVLNTYYYGTGSIISVSIDGGTATNIDLYNAVNSYARNIVLASGLNYGNHTAMITVIGKNPSNTGSIFRTVINYFDVIAPDDNKLRLSPDSQWNKSSAFVGGNRIDATTDLTSQISDITNLIPNASFDRISPTWGTVFQDDFNRADGAVGNGWTWTGTAGSITTNQLTLPANTNAFNGDVAWTDRQIRFSFVANGSDLYAVFKRKDSNNVVDVRFTTTNFMFEKNINGVVTGSISPTNFTITSGTTYYVTLKSQGNIYTASITSNADYATSATTIYHYEDGLPNGLFYFTSIAAITIDSVVVTAPVPDVWTVESTVGSLCSTVESVFTRTNNIGVVNDLYMMTYIPVIGSQAYTISVKKKMKSYTSGQGARMYIYWFNSAKTGISTSSVLYDKTVDSDFVQMTLNANSPSNAAYACIFFGLDGIGTVSHKEPMFVLGSILPPFHTKESRCDLVSLQNDGQVIVTQGTGTSELGYRVEAEDGSISTFWRDKRTVQHWDRVKTWKSGTWATEVSSASNNADIYTSTANDTFYISFVGTGIDMISFDTNARGIMGVTIDGGTEFLVDMYMPNTTYGRRNILARNLPYGQHTIKIRCTSTRNALSVASYIDIDAFDIYVPAIPVNPSLTTMLPVSAVLKADPDYGWIRYEETEGALFSGTWVSSSNTVFSGGLYNYSNTTNDYAEFSFVGSGVRWSDVYATNRGIAEVSMDGIILSNVDLYGTVGYAFDIRNVPLGFHKLKVKVTGTKNASSTGNYVGIDAFDVKNTMYVIDLRKNESQKQIEQAVAFHEGKDLWDAHPQAIKGENPRVRKETGVVTNSVAVAGTRVTKTVTFAKAFTVVPKMTFAMTSFDADNVYINSTLSSITTTGFTLMTNSGFAPQSILINWEATGY